MDRRTLLIDSAGAVTLLGLTRLINNDSTVTQAAERDTSMKAENSTATDTALDIDSPWRSFAPAGTSFPDAGDALVLSDDEWQQRLDNAAYQVLRHEGTERPFTSPLNDNKADGLYVCAGCELPLFTSAMKYNSGTGWPSFFDSVEGHIETSTDYKLIFPRTEYHCKRCGGHHGHVFDDGPQPSGKRFCNNGLALKFVPT